MSTASATPYGQPQVTDSDCKSGRGVLLISRDIWADIDAVDGGIRRRGKSGRFALQCVRLGAWPDPHSGLDLAFHLRYRVRRADDRNALHLLRCGTGIRDVAVQSE